MAKFQNQTHNHFEEQPPNAALNRGRGGRKPKEIVLNVTSNISNLGGLIPGELEFILPAVMQLLEDLAKAPAHEEATEE